MLHSVLVLEYSYIATPHALKRASDFSSVNDSAIKLLCHLLDLVFISKYLQMYRSVCRTRLKPATISQIPKLFQVSTPQALTLLRTFTTTRPTFKMHEYLVTIPDFPNSLDKRVAVRPTHLKGLKPHIDNGTVSFGGAMLSEEFHEGQGKETPDMMGSVMLIKMESEEKIKEWIRNDPYCKGGVWDVEKANIVPFRCAIRTAL